MSPVVVGVEEIGDDWMDAYGHYWAWDETAGHWVHDRDRCRLDDGQACVKSSR